MSEREKSKDLTITVSGYFKSGKSRLIYLLKRYLKEQGFSVEFEANFDHPNEESFDKFASQNLHDVIDNIKTTRKIILREAQFKN
jgi:hypothetical protein